MQKIIRLSLLVITFILLSNIMSHAQEKEMYELRTYELNLGSSLANLESYFTKALIPALNRQGIKHVGAFRETGRSEPVKLYLLIPYASMADYTRVKEKLKSDTEYQKASQEYDQLPADKPVYTRFESTFMIAFDGLPKMIVPENKPRIFEMRTYQGYNEDAVKRKIKMFNESEFDIFYRTKLNPVFFGEVIASKNMPCLTYMITFKDMAEREANWKAFGADATWQKISKAPEYANTVSTIIRVFLEPTTYSQI